MSGLDVIGGISAVISILDASKKVWESAKKDINLPKTFVEVARRLPTLQTTLQDCYDHLLPVANDLPKETIDGLEKSLEVTDEQARALREIFEKTIPGSDAGRIERMKKAVNRAGKGKRVEQLMESISKDAQQIATLPAVKSANPQLAKNMEKLIQDLGGLEPSLPGEPAQGNTFINHDGTQNNNTGKGTQFHYQDMSGKQTFNLGGSQGQGPDSP